ncbi:unnamed protein product [Symbiodinium sp. CCMP2592]|nr:unnamed protein product [Symbiodinium sp. CCMP2592]
MRILVSILGHRSEDPMSNDEMARFFLEGLQELRDSWVSFDLLEPFDCDGWSILTLKGDQAATSINGALRNRLIAKKVQLDNLTFRRSQGQPQALPEQTRVIYEELRSDDEDQDGEPHRLFPVAGGSVWIYLQPSERTNDAIKQVAEFLAIPPLDLALVKMSEPTQETENWIIAGEVPTRHDVALLLVDTALPEAHWLPSQLHWHSLRMTWSPHHSGAPDVITLNGKTVPTWPVNISSGDLLVVRWDGHSEAENAKDLDIFRKLDGRPEPPASPPREDEESSPGGLDDDDHQDPPDDGDDADRAHGESEDPDDGDHNPVPSSIASTLPATIPFEALSPLTPPRMHDSLEPENMEFGQDRPGGLCNQMKYKREMEMNLQENIPPTINYGPARSTMMRNAIYLEFQGQFLPCANADPRTLEQVVQDEWGVPPGSLFFIVQGKPIAGSSACSRISIGAVAHARIRVRGGTHGMMAKLKGLLKQKGVPENLLDERVEKIKKQIGERGIRDAYSSFDPWTQLKASCSTRLVKEAESRNKPKAKGLQPDDDPLQYNDPWTAALQERSQWTLEPSFFRTEGGGHPVALTKVTHGATGIALVTEREAELLLQNQDVMSKEELAALVVGTHMQLKGKFPIQEVEIPCRNQEDRRILIKAQMINLGAKKISLYGEDAKIKVDELDGIILAAEVLRKEATFAAWGKKFFLQGRQTQDAKNADSCFILLRIKRDFRDATLRTMATGIYVAPRSADNKADPSFKVIWFADRPVSELSVLANAEPQAFGIVRSKTGYGIRVKVDDFTRLKQKWQPNWQPLADTPYHLAMNRYYDVQNLPLSCSKVEVQKFLNQIHWKSLAIRQVQPRTWLVGAEDEPPSHVHLADHGTILITEKSPKGAPGTFSGQTPTSSTRPMQLEPDQNGVAELEDRLQKRMEQLHAEQKSAHAILKEDFRAFQETVQAQNAKQEVVNDKLQQGLSDISSTIASQLNQHAATITNALLQSRQEINSDLKTAQISLKEELMGEVKDQMSQLRKRTPSPQRSGAAEEPKKQKASNPGPMTIAALNTQSLNAFIDDGRMCGNPHDVVVFSETAATMFVQQKATKMAHSKGKHLACSKPVGKRGFIDNRDCNTKGQASGTAILSVVPLRPPFQHWAKDSWETSRVVDSLLVHQHGYILVVAIYGYHHGLQDADFHNEALLREAVQRTMAYDCPALIVGDLNCKVQDLAVWQSMVDNGWNDAALVQQDRDGQEPQMTFKEISRIDYILFNDKALPAFRSFAVSTQAETDHKTVVAEFDWSALPVSRRVLRTPANIDALQLDKQGLRDAYLPAANKYALQTALAQQDPQLAWDAFCAAYEATLDYFFLEDETVHFGTRFKGRGKILFRTEKVDRPIRRARKGEFDPSGDEVTLTLRQRIRQIRRLELYISQRSKLDEVTTGTDQWNKIHSAMLATWTAIVRSSGFPGSFATWWFQEVGPAFPLHPPDTRDARWMFEIVREQEVQWRRWPEAITHARMALLNKSDVVGDISTTRPITILATVYRLWGKIMTKKMLGHILPHLPTSLFGSVPGRCPADMTAAVQIQMEESLLMKTDLAGVSLDFSKAYNTLPRPILECINRRLGMDESWAPYHSFLGSLKRHFTCAQTWGPEISSQVGVPEGCPIAVVQMMLITWLFTAFIFSRTSVQIYSYVDDWMMLTKQPAQLISAIQLVDTLARKTGLILSLPKAHVFSLQTKTARALRGNLVHKGISIGLARNFQSLGINLQTTHKITVAQRNQRWNKAKTLLNRLQYMPWDVKRKTAAHKGDIPTDILWCSVLAYWKGTMYEPMFLVAMSRFKAFLRLFSQHQEATKLVWKQSVEHKAYFKNKTKGAVGIFQNQLHDLDRALLADGTCQTKDGWSFCIWSITTSQFQKRLIASWEDNLLSHLQQKQYLVDLASFSMMRSQVPRHRDVMLEGFINKMRLGGLFPNRRKHKVHADNDEHCVFCGEIDTMVHRVYCCPGTQHLRSGDVWDHVKDLPLCQLFGALYPKLDKVDEFKKLLGQVQHDDFQVCTDESEVSFFTDGSALDNENDALRVCSWAVTKAVDDRPTNLELAKGILPGDQQSVFRAELYAVNTAISLAPRCHIYCDNSAVVTILLHLLANGFIRKHWICHPDRDLITTMANLLSHKAPGSVRVTWVKAHRDFASATSPKDLWRIHHNSKADQSAKDALGLIPAPIKRIRCEIRKLLDQDATTRSNAALFMRSMMDEF